MSWLHNLQGGKGPDVGHSYCPSLLAHFSAPAQVSRTDANALIALDPVDLTVIRKFNYTSILPEAKVSTFCDLHPHDLVTKQQSLFGVMPVAPEPPYMMLFVSSHHGANICAYDPNLLICSRLACSAEVTEGTCTATRSSTII